MVVQTEQQQLTLQQVVLADILTIGLQAIQLVTEQLLLLDYLLVLGHVLLPMLTDVQLLKILQ